MNKIQKEEKKENVGGNWVIEKIWDGESTHLIFSMVSSGMGATVCTAGRFLLVAPLTNDEEEEDDEEAESVAPG